MPSDRLDCPRCRKRMHAGFVMDRGDYNVPTPPSWVEGTPEKSFWHGLKTSDRAVLPVVTYRCEGCGYLEAYARAGETPS